MGKFCLRAFASVSFESSASDAANAVLADVEASFHQSAGLPVTVAARAAIRRLLLGTVGRVIAREGVTAIDSGTQAFLAGCAAKIARVATRMARETGRQEIEPLDVETASRAVFDRANRAEQKLVA